MELSAPVFRLKHRARQLAREEKLALHTALDRIAADEGFNNWGHLSAALPKASAASEVLGDLDEGDLVLLGARPGHGKTRLAIEMALSSALAGRPAWFFTLDYIHAQVVERLVELGAPLAEINGMLEIDTSDEISAGYIVDRLAGQSEAFVAIDYLQLLDQKRSNPDLEDQVQLLRAFAQSNGATIVVISQIHRSFEGRSGLPSLADVRLPNPLDLRLFTKTCFLHDGEVRVQTL